MTSTAPTTSTYDLLGVGRATGGLGPPWHGVHVATVVDVVDPDSQGRVRVRLPWSPDTDPNAVTGYEAWARLATVMAGNNRGTWLVPDVDDEVLVAFEGGSPDRPVVLGALWNGQDRPPDEMDDGGENNRKTIRSREGIELVFDDTSGSVVFSVETPGGHKVTLDDGAGSVTISDTAGSTIVLDAGGISMSTTTLTIDASSVQMSAGSVTVTSGQSTFSGAVTTASLTTSSVVSASYTPGAGNIL